MGFFDFVGDIFNPENIGTALGGLIGSAVLPGIGTSLGAGLGRAAGGLVDGDGLGGAITDLATGAGLGAAATGGLGGLIRAGAGTIGPGGTAPIAPTSAGLPTFGGATAPTTPEEATEETTAQALTPTTQAPAVSAPPPEEEGGGGFLGALGDIGSGLLDWLTESPESALGVVQSLLGYQTAREQAEYNEALLEEERRRQENLGRIAGALSRGLAAQLP